MGDKPLPFWETTPLEDMSSREWESLCDGCGRCCLNKLIDDDTEELHYTMVGCALLDVKKCNCTNYAQRTEIVDDCVELTPKNLKEMNWLPPTCAYRRVAEGRTLSWWHPLVSGRQESVHEAGISVRGKIVSETHMHPDDLWGARVKWPLIDDYETE